MTGGKFKLPKRHRMLFRELRRELRGTGIGFDYDLTGRHPKLYFVRDNRIMSMPFSSTPRVDMPEEHAKRKARAAVKFFNA